MSPIIGIIASSRASANNFNSIATQIASGSSTTITFDNIPNTYKYLQLHCYYAVATSDSELLIRFNGDSSSASYNKSQVYARGSSSGGMTLATSSTTTATAVSGPVYYGNSTSSYGSSIVNIYDYSSTNKVKMVHTLTGAAVDSAGAGAGIFSRMGLWNNSSTAISSMVLSYTSGTGNILAGSHFALYGIGG